MIMKSETHKHSTMNMTINVFWTTCVLLRKDLFPLGVVHLLTHMGKLPQSISISTPKVKISDRIGLFLNLIAGILPRVIVFALIQVVHTSTYQRMYSLVWKEKGSRICPTHMSANLRRDAAEVHSAAYNQIPTQPPGIFTEPVNYAEGPLSSLYSLNTCLLYTSDAADEL